jgi:hypothetical protein
MDKLIQFRCNDKQLTVFNAAAEKMGMSLSGWLRFAALSVAGGEPYLLPPAPKESTVGEKPELKMEQALPKSSGWIIPKPEKRIGPTYKPSSVATVDDEDALRAPMKNEFWLDYNTYVDGWVRRNLKERFDIGQKAKEDYRRAFKKVGG